MTYNTKQYITLQYACGCGGKFLTSVLMLFDRVAHWSPEVQQNPALYTNWFEEQWAEDLKKWSTTEPHTPWDINFYSRRLSRGNQLTETQFNTAVDQHANKYFHSCWQQGLMIADTWYKKTLPAFFTNTTKIEILLDENSVDAFKHMIKNKIWLWNEKNKTITSMLDSATWISDKYSGSEKEKRLALAGSNIIKGYHSYDSFFENYLLEQHYVGDFYCADANPDAEASFSFSSLLNTDKFLETVVPALEKVFDQHLDRDQLKNMHIMWLSRSGL